MRIEGQTGPQVLQDGTIVPPRLSKSGEVIVSELHGKYYEQSYRGNIFHAVMTAGVIFPAPAATANNVFTLANPAGSGKNLSLIRFDMVITTINATPATGAYGLYVNTNVVAAPVTGTAIVPIPGLIGSNFSPVGKAFSTSTLPAAPTLFRAFAYKETGGVVTAVPISGLPSFSIEFDGLAVLSPGTAITPQLSAADTTNATVICGMVWEENPI